MKLAHIPVELDDLPAALVQTMTTALLNMPAEEVAKAVGEAFGIFITVASVKGSDLNQLGQVFTSACASGVLKCAAAMPNGYVTGQNGVI